MDRRIWQLANQPFAAEIDMKGSYGSGRRILANAGVSTGWTSRVTPTATGTRWTTTARTPGVGGTG
jgi:hypothetical protein